MLLDLSPLARYRDFRLLYTGQFVSTLGTMMTMVALPYQLYHLTGSSLAVGMVGIAQLIPLLFTALLGGAFADAMDRRKLLIITETVLLVCSILLMANALSPHPQTWIVFALAAIGSGVSGFHRPAMSAMIPRLVHKDDIPAVSVLGSTSGSASAIAGPALGGSIIAFGGVGAVYLADAVSFGFSLATLLMMKPMAPILEKSAVSGFQSIKEGLQYARSRQDLVGTYVVDIIAMVFGMPMALFPAVAEGFGGAAVIGWFYSAPFVGAFVVSAFSKWTFKVRRHGAAVAIAAIVWGFAIVAFGYSKNLWVALFFLAFAGGADMVSGIFRNTIWNTTIPDNLRGRLAGIEMISYMSGPQIGNAESGLAASLVGVQMSIVSGGVFCVLGIALAIWRLPRFWAYDSEKYQAEQSA